MAKILKNAGTFNTRLLLPKPFTRPSASVAIENSNDSPESLLSSAKPFDDVPGHKRLPGIGSSWVFLPIIGKYSATKLHVADKEKYNKFGDIVRDRFGSVDFVHVYHPNDIEAIFRNAGEFPSRGALYSFEAYRTMRREWYTTMGVLISEGKEWYDLRFKLQRNMMRLNNIDVYVKPMFNVASDLVSKMTASLDQNKEVPNFMDELYNWSLESVAYVALDTRLGCLNRNLASDSEAMKVIDAVKTIFLCMNNMEAFTGSAQLWRWFPTPIWRKFVKVMDFFSETAFKYVYRSLDELKKKNIDEVKELTFLQAMLSTEGMVPSETMTMVVDMLFAGIDTTSNTVGSFLYNLAKNPEVQEKMHREIMTVLPSPTDEITPEVLKKLRYVKYCLKESMRLTPLLRGIVRRVDKDIVLSGYRVPSGTLAMGMMQVACQQEKYFKNADKFIPERWLDKEDKPHPFLFQPFGFGIRSCIGRRLAELEMLCLAIQIVRRFKLEYHHEDIGMFTNTLIKMDRPLRLTFIKRE